LRERIFDIFFFIYLFLITSTRTTEIVQSTETHSQTQNHEESYAVEEKEYHDGDMTGQIIANNYQIQSKLGAGSFGQVYLCEHIHTHEQWAIKIELHSTNTNPILAAEVK
jgi:serine/threonine protein kinase